MTSTKVRDINTISKTKIKRFIKSLGEAELKHWRGATRLLNSNVEGVAAVDGKNVVALAYFFRLPPKYPLTTGIVGIVTKKEYWGQGICQGLLLKMEKYATQHCITRLLAGVDYDNAKSLWIFEKNGYIIVNKNPESGRYGLEKEVRTKANWFFPIREGEIIVDLGASNGCISIQYLEALKDTGLIIAVEPSEASFEMLKRNIGSRVNVKVLRAAISDKSGHEKLWTLESKYGNPMYGNSTTFQVEGWDHVETVDAIMWDDLVDKFNLDRVDYCKVDVEGAEIKLLKGMTQVLPNKIMIECHRSIDPKFGSKKHTTPDGVKATWWSEPEVIKLLEEKGYEILAEAASHPYIYAKR